MAETRRPTHRLTIKNKQSGKATTVGNLWPTQFKDSFNLSFGAKAYEDQPGVTLEGLVLNIAGKKVTVTTESHYINVNANRPPKPRKDEGADEPDEVDGADEDEDSPNF